VVRGVFFKTLCFHAEPFCAEPGAGVSATKFAELLGAELQALDDERGVPIVIYTGVQNNAQALDAARRNGLVPTGLIMHERRFEPAITKSD